MYEQITQDFCYSTGQSPVLLGTQQWELFTCKKGQATLKMQNNFEKFKLSNTCTAKQRVVKNMMFRHAESKYCKLLVFWVKSIVSGLLAAFFLSYLVALPLKLGSQSF